jgi:hypothetical protein
VVRLNIVASRKHEYFSAVYGLPSLNFFLLNLHPRKWEAVVAKRLQGLIFFPKVMILFGRLKQFRVCSIQLATTSLLVLELVTTSTM